MREILFKAKRLGNGEWVEGFYVCCRKSHYILPIFNEDESFHGFDDRYDDWVEVDVSTLCQYTGLTDKNGKKIWENDIITISAYDYLEPTNDYTGIVCYFEKDACWCLGDFDEKDKIIPICECYGDYTTEIFKLGNIFDNPELLEQEG